MGIPRVLRQQKANVINLGSKKITKYTSRDKELEINHMIVSGRHPEYKDHFIYETACFLMIYIMKGRARVLCNEDIFEVKVGDVVEIPPKTKFAIECNNVEYLSLQHPAWNPDQSFIVDRAGNTIEDT